MTMQLPDFPDVAPEQVQTCGIDFGYFLPDGAFLSGPPVLVLSVHSGVDAVPQSRVSGGPAIATVPPYLRGSGVPSAAVVFQVAGCLAGVTYTVEVYCPRSDGDVAEAWSRLPCVGPS